MPYPERLLSPNERVETEFRPHWRSVLVQMLMTLVVIVAVVVILVMVGGIAKPISAGLIGLVWLIFVVPEFIRWWFTRYIITNERLIVRAGVLSRRGKEIPLEVINDVAFSQHIGERIFRSGDLLIESAGEMGQSRFQDIPDPEHVQSIIYRLRENRMLALESGRTPADQLETLARLHREGVLSDEEFAAKKEKLLGDI